MITIDTLREFFNLYPSDVSQSEFDRAYEVAKERYKNLLGLSSFPSSFSPVEEELVLHLILLELLKKYNFLTGEGTQRFSINKVSEHIERLLWIIKTQTN